MLNYTRNMNQDATYWAPGVDDGFGSIAFGSPTPIKCRWQDKSVMFRDKEGRERTSDAVVYVDRPLIVGGFLAQGLITGDVNVKAIGKEILSDQSSPNLDATYVLNKVLL